ncbi:L-proline dehydrogenase [Cyclonatronum proteinivorum]|uniref:proline dehydrogenase n=1 Tax=Cyclonatronum proteinivorum TaxID=1457365 RepID=A0A345UGK3_9BACT|nr:proline dehydrogenase family protein [Cyclonatronum proteinivorum]AXI99604.1 L-proline dehydrogenase [Cyclonatronum proteinivorum]
MKLPFAVAKRFVAGESLNQAVPKVADLNEYGIKVTLDLLGENVTDRTMADETLQHYIELLEGIHEQKIDSTISIKLTMLGLDIDRDYCRDNLFKLLDAAVKYDQFIRIDMEGTDYTQLTIDLFKEAFRKYGKHVGIVIQAYLHRTKDDIDELSALGADIRLCKGAYNEPERLALQKMDAIREAYKEYLKVLFDKTVYPRIATHDDKLISWVKEYTQQKGIGQSRFEFQMLYGMRLDTCKSLAAEGYNVRVYVPYGTMWFPYFTRRLKERKENIWFVLSTMFKK